jgi:hypothetical protein
MSGHVARLASRDPEARRHFIGGSDARVIMGSDEAALVRLWREKRGEVATSKTRSRPQRLKAGWASRRSSARDTQPKDAPNKHNFGGRCR